MAGLVGAAVIAPGIALADSTDTASSTSAQCLTQGKVLDLDTMSCVVDATAAGSPATTPETPDPTVPETAPSGTASSGTAAGSGATSDTDGAPAATTPSAPAASKSSSAATGTTAPAAAVPARTFAAIANPAVVVPTGVTLPEALTSLPAGNLPLSGLLEVPAFPDGGTFTDPRQACAFLASRVAAPDGSDPTALAQQFAAFCSALPTSFDSSGLSGLVDSLTDLLAKLAASFPTTITPTAVANIDPRWRPYFNSAFDIDCGQLTFEEAQAILAQDPSDPNRLDGDNDGIACENSPRGYASVTDGYAGYPRGGVATGDSAPGVDPGLAAALGGLALATVAGATRRATDDAGAEAFELVGEDRE